MKRRRDGGGTYVLLDPADSTEAVGGGRARTPVAGSSRDEMLDLV
jgi:hypothetical protein